MLDLEQHGGAEPELRMTAYSYRTLYGRRPVGIWRAPGAITLVSDQTHALSLGLRWGAVVAAEARTDDVLELRTMNRWSEGVQIRLSDAASANVPSWAAAPLQAVTSLRAAGQSIGGATVLVNAEVPQDAGLGVHNAIASASALALSDIYRLGVAPAQLWACLRDGRRSAGPDRSPCPASLLARAGHVALYDVQGSGAVHLPCDLSAAGLRLVLIISRCHLQPPMHRATGQVGADGPAIIRRVTAVLRAGDLSRLGPLLTDAHNSACGARASSPQQTACIKAALSAGALGARALCVSDTAPVIALARTDSVIDIRMAIARAHDMQGWPRPRLLTATPVAADGRIVMPTPADDPPGPAPPQRSTK